VVSAGVHPPRCFVHWENAERSPERALLLAGRDDVVVVGGAVDRDHLDYLASLDVGPRAENVLVASSPADPELPARIVDLARGAQGILLCPATGTAESHELALAVGHVLGHEVRALGARPDLARALEQKHLVRSRAIELGIPTGLGEVVELAFAGGRRRRDLEPVRAAIERRLPITGRVLVRGSVGASGGSTFVVGRGDDDTDGVLRRIAQRSDNRVYLVDSMLEATVSPTVLIHLDADTDKVQCCGIADRRWGKRLIATGATHPTASRVEQRILEWSRMLAGWLLDEGYTGPAAFDFVEYRDLERAEPQAFLAEVHAGVDEALYPMALRARLGLPAFVSGTVPTGVTTFGGVRELLGGLLLTRGGASGVVPVPSQSLAGGRCPLVALGVHRLHAAELFGKAQAALAPP
jgi:hypothetical protein